MKKHFMTAFITSLGQHVLTAAAAFEKEAIRHPESLCSTYLRYLAERKHTQLALFEKAISHFHHHALAIGSPLFTIPGIQTTLSPLFSEATLDDIYYQTVDRSEQEVAFFLLANAGNPPREKHTLLATLINLEKDFLFDAHLGYFDLSSGQTGEGSVTFDRELVTEK